jgi:hypothetical protein
MPQRTEALTSDAEHVFQPFRRQPADPAACSMMAQPIPMAQPSLAWLGLFERAV